MMSLYIWILTAFAVSVYSQPPEFEAIGICDQPWTPAYAHDYRGVFVVGSLPTLQERILNGFLVRVQFSTKEWLITFGLDDFTFRGRHVCGSSMWFLSDNSTHIDPDADWLPTLVCTNGEVSRLNHTSASWISEVGKQDIELDGEIWWYTKPTTHKKEPVYSHFVDGSDALGSFDELMRFAKKSELRANMRDRGYAFVIQNQKIYDNEVITAQSLNHISLRYTQDAVRYNQEPYYSWLSVWSTNGRRDVSRWFLANTTLYKHNNDFVSLDWYGDQCWRKVYATDRYGFSIFGSVEELVQMIKLGHRVRIYFDGYNVKANGIRVVDGMVIAQSIEEYARRGRYPSYDAPFFNSRARVVYRLIHSTGKVKSYMYNIDDFTLSDKEEEKKYAIDWMVDRRQWNKVLRTDALGQPTSGLRRDLEDAVATGASVRLNVEQDELAGQFYTEADNVRINFFTNEVYAQALKHISDKKILGVNEYNLQPQVFRWSLMVSSSGVVAMNARRLATKSHLYDAVSPATNVTWFVNN